MENDEPHASNTSRKAPSGKASTCRSYESGYNLPLWIRLEGIDRKLFEERLESDEEVQRILGLRVKLAARIEARIDKTRILRSVLGIRTTTIKWEKRQYRRIKYLLLKRKHEIGRILLREKAEREFQETIKDFHAKWKAKERLIK
jgi:ribosomal protein S10